MSLTIATATSHPLAALTEAEIDRAREVFAASGLVTEHTRFTYVMLREPHKRDVLDPDRAPGLHREVEALLLDFSTGAVTQAVADITAGEVVHTRELDPVAEGTAPVLDEEFTLVDDIVKADPGWVAALAKRGIHDVSAVRTCPLTAGHFDYDDEEGRRMFRVLAFVQQSESDLPWAHPIDGVVAHVDTLSRSVIRLVETPVDTVPMESGDYLDPEVTGPLRTTLKPIEITQPEGVSFEYRDGVLSWENWDLRVGFNGREGLTLHDVAFTYQQERRPILYRASISEMVVNYADPTPIHGWQNYYDAGEYQFGRLANSLELGCDCLGDIFYLDAVVADDFAGRAPSRTRSASTRRTTASSGSTPTSSPTPPRPAASAAWSSPSSRPSATTTTASTSTSTWTGRSRWRPRPRGSSSPAPTTAATTRTPPRSHRASEPRCTSTCSAPGST